MGARGVPLGQSPRHGSSGLCENPTPKRVLQVKGAYPVLTEIVQEGRAGVLQPGPQRKMIEGLKDAI